VRGIGLKRSRLLPKPQFLDNILISKGIRSSQVVEQSSPLTDELKKASSGVVILLVSLEMFREVIDAIAQDGNLHFRGTRVLVMQLETIDDLLLSLWVENHFCYLLV
jgi:hypothetical protein